MHFPPSGVMVSFCCAIHNRAKMLQGLLDSLDRLKDGKFELVVVDFESTDSEIGDMLADAAFGIQLITVSEPFARSRGLNLAAAHARGERLFFTDTDMTYPAGFLLILERYVLPERTYFPVFYSLHEGKPMAVDGNSRDPSEANGWWRTSSFGMCGFMRDDFEAVGRWNERYKICGEEDVELFCRTRQQLRVVRRRCPGLFHRWHYENRWGH